MAVECRSSAMQQIANTIKKVAPTDLNILITGESGVGKEVVAYRIFKESLRQEHPFIKINSAALPNSLIESELFGYKKGAFTGASNDRKGKVQSANRGTLFFDEIAELNMDSQSKLLQIIQDKEFTPLGRNTPIRVDIRILAATNRDLTSEVARGTFREDLFYRLNVVFVQVPALRERQEDVSVLFDYFLGLYSEEYEQALPRLKSSEYRAVQEYTWPGNVRELQNFSRNLVLLGNQAQALEQLRAKASQRRLRSNGQEQELSLLQKSRAAEQAVEQKIIRRVLQRNGWNRKKTAGMLNISYRSLLSKMKKYGMQ